MATVSPSDLTLAAFFSHFDKGLEFVIERYWIEFFLILIAALVPARETVFQRLLFAIIFTGVVVFTKRLTARLRHPELREKRRIERKVLNKIHSESLYDPGANDPEPMSWWVLDWMMR